VKYVKVTIWKDYIAQIIIQDSTNIEKIELEINGVKRNAVLRQNYTKIIHVGGMNNMGKRDIIKGVIFIIVVTIGFGYCTFRAPSVPESYLVPDISSGIIYERYTSSDDTKTVGWIESEWDDEHNCVQYKYHLYQEDADE
jgi:hypothetical protein